MTDITRGDLVVFRYEYDTDHGIVYEQLKGGDGQALGLFDVYYFRAKQRYMTHERFLTLIVKSVDVVLGIDLDTLPQ